MNIAYIKIISLNLQSKLFACSFKYSDVLYPFNNQCLSHIETSQLICSGNWTLIWTLIVEGLKKINLIQIKRETVFEAPGIRLTSI